MAEALRDFDYKEEMKQILAAEKEMLEALKQLEKDTSLNKIKDNDDV